MSVISELAAKQFSDATAGSPYVFDLGPVAGRETFDAAQAGPVTKPPADIECATVPGGLGGEVSVRILRPPGRARKASCHRLYARQRLGIRQQAHARPALPRPYSWRSPCCRFPELQPLPGGEVPDRDRAELRPGDPGHLEIAQEWVIGVADKVSLPGSLPGCAPCAIPALPLPAVRRVDGPPRLRQDS